MKSELSPIERGRLYSQGHEVDRIPVGFISSETAGYLYGYNVRSSYLDADAIVDIESRLFEEFCADGIRVGPGLRGVAETMGAKVCYPENSICYVSAPAFNSYDEMGALTVLNKRTLSKRMQVNLESIKRLCDKFSGIAPVRNDVGGPVSTAAALRGYDRLLRDFRRNPEEVKRLLSLSVENILEWVRIVYTECGVAPSFAEPFISGDLISHAVFEEFAKPALAQLFSGVKTITGASSGLHVCGRSKYIWSDMDSIGVSSLSIDDAESLLEFKTSVGHKMGLGGNVSPTQVLLLGSPADVHAAVKKALLEGSDNPKGYTLSAGCQIPVGAPRENLTAFMEAACTYGKNAQKGALCKGLSLV